MNSANEMPIDAYARQGVFEELYAWIDQDAEFGREDFLVNIFEAYASEGRLYRLPTSFTIDSYAAKTSVVGELTEWTLESVRELAAEYPYSSLFEGQVTRDVMLRGLVEYEVAFDRFNGTCSFDSEEFIGLLEWLGELPAEKDDQIKWPMQRENKILLSVAVLNTLESFQWMEKRTFGEPVTYVGLPGGSGEGLIVDGEIVLAMSAQSDCKEGAWEFMRGYLLEEYQQTVSSLPEFPVRLSVLELLAEEAVQGKRGQEVYYLDGNEVIIPAMTAEEVNRALTYIREVSRTGTLEAAVYRIVSEEAEPFFAGQKTAEETARIIQSRVEIYLAEKQ